MLCYLCRNFKGTFSQPAAGGGCENIAKCDVVPAFEQAARGELASFGWDNQWLVGQTGYTGRDGVGRRSSPSEEVIREADLEEELFEAIDSVQESDDWEVVFRDVAWEAFDDYLATLPQMKVSTVRSGHVCQRCGGSGRFAGGTCFRCDGAGLMPWFRTAHIRADRKRNWFTLLRESDAIRHVMERAEGCPSFKWRDQDQEDAEGEHFFETDHSKDLGYMRDPSATRSRQSLEAVIAIAQADRQTLEEGPPVK